MQVVHSGFMDDLSDYQREVLEMVKKHIRVTLGNTDPRWTDWYILRFCRARKFAYEKVIEMIDKCIRWSQDMKVAQIGAVDLGRYAQLREWYSHGYYNTDKLGRPLYIEEVKKLKTKEVFAEYSDAELTTYYVQSYERLIHIIFPECSRIAGRRIEQTCTIMDLKDVNTFSLFSGKVKAFLKIAMDIGQDHYPEILGNMYIINTGMLFSGMWMLVKPWIDPKTQQKIKLISGSGKKELAEVVAPENLPEFLGGTCKHALKEDYGPWHEELVASQQNQTVFHRDQQLVDNYYLSNQEKEAKRLGMQNAPNPGLGGNAPVYNNVAGFANNDAHAANFNNPPNGFQ